MIGSITHAGFSAGASDGDIDSLDRALGRLADLGADLCELSAVTLDCVSAARLIPARIAAVRAVLLRRPMRTTLHAPIPVNLMDEAHLTLQRRVARASLELAAELSADIVVMHPGRVSPCVWAARAKRLLALEREELGQLGERALELGLRVAYENPSPTRRMIAGEEIHPALDPRRHAEQLRALGHPAVVGCLDVAHLRQACELLVLDNVEMARLYGPLVGHIHFSDAEGTPATPVMEDRDQLFYGTGDMHARAGWGSVDYEALAAALAPLPGTGIAIELKSNHFRHGAAETLAAARAFAERINARDPARAAR